MEFNTGSMSFGIKPLIWDGLEYNFLEYNDNILELTARMDHLLRSFSDVAEKLSLLEIESVILKDQFTKRSNFIVKKVFKDLTLLSIKLKYNNKGWDSLTSVKEVIVSYHYKSHDSHTTKVPEPCIKCGCTEMEELMHGEPNTALSLAVKLELSSMIKSLICKKCGLIQNYKI